MSDDPLMNRRVTDRIEVVERVVALETNVGNIKDAIHSLGDDLREHISTESEVIKDLAVSMQKVVTATEMNAATMERVSTTLQTMADHTTRVQALESWREKAEPNIEKARMMWWGAATAFAVAVVIVSAAWTVITKMNLI